MTESASTPFHDLEHYVALPRVSRLALSRDGERLVTAVATLDPQCTRYVTALWEVDPSGVHPARRLTRSAKGESAPLFTADGDLLFTSARPDPDTKDDGELPEPALWLMPAAGGEARVVGTAPGGVGGLLAAARAPLVSVTSGLLPSSRDLEHDEENRTARTEAKVSAILHTGYPVRHWDHDLGPAQPHRFVADTAGLSGPEAPGLAAGTDVEQDGPCGRVVLRDLTPRPGHALIEHSADLSADGSTLVVTWQVSDGVSSRSTLVAIDVASGERRTLVDDPTADAGSPAISPDGHWVAFVRSTLSTPDDAPRVGLGIAPLAAGLPVDVTERALAEGPTALAADWDRWPGRPHWLPDGAGLLVTADDGGRAPVFHVALTLPGASRVQERADRHGQVTRVTADDAVFTDLQVAPDGSCVYALRSSYLEPAHPVRIDLASLRADGSAGPGGEPVTATRLRAPASAPELPGTLTEVETTAEDGSRVRAWLALPEGADADDPAPLLLWIHGGPLGSWNTWSWRWNPWLMVARGYAVLLPDPALSLGYGQDFVQRGWGAWGKAPFTDLMAITDTVVARADIDADRTAAMGGSFGGYMANWVAGHTDRFRAIVTHASLWALDQFGPTTDHADYWGREMTPQMAHENSPHRFVGDIVTPMLVVHGDKDYRVPIGEGLRLWYELLSASGLPAADDGSTVHRFLYFPTENHWVLSPQHAAVWYGSVLAFLAEHVLGIEPGVGEAHYPPILG
ncbi:MAG: alpha/beta fold hydrolase [Cellulomonadaceae bacterium]